MKLTTVNSMSVQIISAITSTIKFMKADTKHMGLGLSTLIFTLESFNKELRYGHQKSLRNIRLVKHRLEKAGPDNHQKILQDFARRETRNFSPCFSYLTELQEKEKVRLPRLKLKHTINNSNLRLSLCFSLLTLMQHLTTAQKQLDQGIAKISIENS